MILTKENILKTLDEMIDQFPDTNKTENLLFMVSGLKNCELIKSLFTFMNYKKIDIVLGTNNAEENFIALKRYNKSYDLHLGTIHVFR